MCNIRAPARDEVVDTDNVLAFPYEAVAHVTAQESRAPRYHYKWLVVRFTN
jgi:hypothetical protein